MASPLALGQTNHESNVSSSTASPDARPSTPTMVSTAEIVTSPVPTVAGDDYQSTDDDDEEEEEGEDDDGDSAFAATSNLSETATVDSSIMKFRVENGRTYHTYGSTDYYGPNDESAQEQQDISHHFWTLLRKGELHSAPVQKPHRVLDVGTGTGMWVIDMADKYPEASVKGIDVSPIQPFWIPPNARFEMDDFNLEWEDHEKFDLIHARELLGCVPNWNLFYANCFRALKPGAWIDCSEPSFYLESGYDTLEDDHCYKAWRSLMAEAGDKAGMSFDVGPYIRERLEEAGFVNIVEKRVCCTVGKWSNNSWEREVGLWNQLRLSRGVQDFCERRFMKQLGWSADEVTVFCAQLRAAIRTNRILAHQLFYFVQGQKPKT